MDHFLADSVQAFQCLAVLKFWSNYPPPGVFAEALDGVDAELPAFSVYTEGLPEVDEFLGRVDDDLHVFIVWVLDGSAEAVDLRVCFQTGRPASLRRPIGDHGCVVQDIAAVL